MRCQEHANGLCKYRGKAVCQPEEGASYSIFRVIKRDGSEVELNLEKISGAMVKAFDATQVQYNQAIVDLLTLRVTADMQGKVKEGKVQVEEVSGQRREGAGAGWLCRGCQGIYSCIVSSVRRCAI